MSDKIYLGSRLADLDFGEPSLPVSKVILNVDGETCYQSGDDTGATIEADCHWATQAMADSILAKMQGFVYKPFTGTDTLLDPSAELGDGITLGGVYSVLSQLGRNLDRQATATVGAPGTDEIEDEYPYKSKQRKQTDRALAKAYSRISKTADEIRLQVFGEDGPGEESLRAEIAVELDKISSEVFDENGNSRIDQTAAAIRSEVQAELYTESTDEDGNTVYTAKYSTIEQTANSISASVNGLLNGEEVQAKIDATLKEITLSISSAEGGSSITLTSGDVTITSSTVNLCVDAANISGQLTAGQIDATELKVDAANITGTLKLSQIASISFEDLSDSEDIMKQIKSAGGLDEDAVTTLITSTLVSSPNIAGGKFGDLNYDDKENPYIANWLEMGQNDAGTIGYLNHYCSGYSDSSPVCVMGFVGTGIYDEWVLAPFNKIRLEYIRETDTMYPVGTWNFSQADDVSGLSSTAVFG